MYKGALAKPVSRASHRHRQLGAQEIASPLKYSWQKNGPNGSVQERSLPITHLKAKNLELDLPDNVKQLWSKAISSLHRMLIFQVKRDLRSAPH